MTNDVMASLYGANGLQVGVQPETDPEEARKAGGSTDMGNVSHVVPSIHPEFYIGTGASLHTRAFAAQASKSVHKRTQWIWYYFKSQFACTQNFSEAAANAQTYRFGSSLLNHLSCLPDDPVGQGTELNWNEAKVTL